VTAPDPILRVVPEPADINSNGHIFGGWVLAMMDRAGGIAAGRVAQSRCATVAIEAMEFIAPILMGDVVSIYAKVERRGRTSVAIRVDVIASRDRGRVESKVTTGVFTFVALDEDFKPTPLPTVE
jgi:acyl-CoA thioesterase YciA